MNKYIIKIKLKDFKWNKKTELNDNLFAIFENEDHITIDQDNEEDTNLIELWVACEEQYEASELYETIFTVITDTLEDQPTGDIRVITMVEETFEF